MSCASDVWRSSGGLNGRCRAGHESTSLAMRGDLDSVSLGRSNPRLRRHAESARKPATSAASAVPRNEKNASMPTANADDAPAALSALAVAPDRSVPLYASSPRVKVDRRGAGIDAKPTPEVRAEPTLLGTARVAQHRSRREDGEEDARIVRRAVDARDEATARDEVETDTAATTPVDMAPAG